MINNTADFKSAYLAYMEFRLRILMDRWTWEDPELEGVIEDHRLIIECVKCSGMVFLHGHDGLEIRWRSPAHTGNGGSQTMDMASVCALIRQWKQGEFNND